MAENATVTPEITMSTPLPFASAPILAADLGAALGATDGTSTVTQIVLNGNYIHPRGSIRYDSRMFQPSASSRAIPGQAYQILMNGWLDADYTGTAKLADSLGAAADSDSLGGADSAWWCLCRPLYGSDRNWKPIHQSNLIDLADLKTLVGAIAADWVDPTAPDLPLPV